MLDFRRGVRDTAYINILEEKWQQEDKSLRLWNTVFVFGFLLQSTLVLKAETCTQK